MNTFLLTTEICCLFGLLLLSAFFSSSETALFSINTLDIAQIRKRKPSIAIRLELLLAAPTRLLSTILIGNTIVNVCASALGFALLVSLKVPHAEVITIPSMTILLLLAGEVIPKRFAMKQASNMAIFYARPLAFCIWLFTPARFVLERFGNLFDNHLKAHTRSLSEDEFLTVVEVGEEEGVLNEEEREMVDGIIRLEETEASDIMTPRVDMVGIDLDDPTAQQMKAIRHCRYHFLPLYRETMDHIEGLLSVPQFLLAGATDIESATQKPYFVPENAPLDTLLADFQRDNRRVAIVADEFGGTAGLITRGDIIEEIADDVDNEFGDPKDKIQKIDENRWLITGDCSIEDVNYELDLNLEADGADRMAGWVTDQMERIPRAGEVTEAQGCRVTVQRLRRQRILRVMLEKIDSEEDNEQESLF
jgi:putative hemolysin